MSDEDYAAARRVLVALDGICAILPIYTQAHEAAAKTVLGDDLAEMLSVIPQLFNDIGLMAVKRPRQFAQYVNLFDQYIAYIRGEAEIPKISENDPTGMGLNDEEYERAITAAADKKLKAWNVRTRGDIE